MRKMLKRAAIGIPVGILLLIAISFFSPVRTFLESWTADREIALNSSETALSVSEDQQRAIDLSVAATLQALTPSATPTLPPTDKPLPPSPTQTPSPLPTLTPTPLPEAVQITGIDYQHQHGLRNYCGPANLAMSVSFWGWQTDRLQTGDYLRGGTERRDDKNIMPYELQNYINDMTGLRMVIRAGGNLDLLKSLIAGGFPVIVEKDDVIRDVGWLGHYLYLYGYDEEKREFYSMDTYHGEGTPYDFDVLIDSWRAFNFTFLVTYPPEKEAELFALLGDHRDENWATQRALEIAANEAVSLTGLARYFAWFNLGTNYVQLQDYASAAEAYDTAYQAYAELETENLPWRMLWYQTGPYFAYFYSGRYGDVLALANQTLDAMNDPILEESFYWRALAKEALGDRIGAIEDLSKSVELNKNFGPGWNQLTRIQNGG
jgi:hypothetical protein